MQQTITLTGTVDVPDAVPAQVRRLTWSPLVGADIMTGQKYQYQTGNGYRIGDWVRLWGYIQYAAFGTLIGGNVLKIKGFPYYTARLPGFFAGTLAYWSNQHPQPSYASIACYAGGGQNEAILVGQETTGSGQRNPIFMTPMDPNDHSQFIFSIDYITDDPQVLPTGEKYWDLRPWADESGTDDPMSLFSPADTERAVKAVQRELALRRKSKTSRKK